MLPDRTTLDPITRKIGVKQPAEPWIATPLEDVGVGGEPLSGESTCPRNRGFRATGSPWLIRRFPPADPLSFVHRCLAILQDGFGINQEGLTGQGQRHTLLLAVKKFYSQLGFQVMDLFAEGTFSREAA